MAKRTKHMELRVDKDSGAWSEHTESEFPGAHLKLTRSTTGRVGWEIRVTAFEIEEAIRIATDADAKLRQWHEICDRLLEGLPSRDGQESPFLQRT